MKIVLTFKTPDVDDHLDEVTKNQLSYWIKYNEYITIEFNLKTGEATVMRPQ